MSDGVQVRDRSALLARQDAGLHALLAGIDGRNPFYSAKLRQAGLTGSQCPRATFLERFPFTSKADLVADQLAHPPFGSNLTFPIERYVRMSQTSGSTGTPLRWLDTAESWSWMLDCWVHFFRCAGVVASDRVFAAFSFGPFLGFWTAFEAAARIGCLTIPGGGLSTRGRLEAMRDAGATVLCCTPTYAIRLGEAAIEEAVSVTSVRLLFLAGEPGGSIAATRSRLEGLWPGATMIDHHGMTEVGPVSWQFPGEPRYLHVLESAYLAEIIDPRTLMPVEPGQTGELVLTNLGRLGSPIIRYRTGDIVRSATQPPADPHLALEGGILGRTDDMVIVRGINVYPSAIEAVVRRFAEVAEYRVDLSVDRGMAELSVTVEPTSAAQTQHLAERLSEELRTALTLRIPVAVAQPGSLPRFEMKSRRWVRHAAGPAPE
jgi:phenylacetate-CoA ligase